MARATSAWKKGRGRLGVLDPPIGTWKARTESPRGPVRVLGGAYVRLTAVWEYAKGGYEELALYGVSDDGKLAFWSFTSDGKHSVGVIADVNDIHPEAIGFEAQMPAGLARMAYWPDGAGGFHWVVEAQTKKGWKRFTEHHYTAS